MKSKKKVLVLTGSDSNMHTVLDLTIPSKIKYTQKHGYDFQMLRSFKELPEFGNLDGGINNGFTRTIQAFQMLEHYDVVMWLDGDSIITDDTYCVEDFLQQDCVVHVSYDWPVASDGSTGHMGFGFGNFILQNTSDTLTVFNTFLQVSQRYLNDGGADQACFNAIYNQTPLRSCFKVLEHRYLNAVPEVVLTTEVWASDPNRVGPNRTFPIVSPWTDTSFLAHLTGCTTQDRITLLQTHFKKYL